MPSLIYDVAVSIDGYISGPDGDVSKFPATGVHVDAYLERLATYSAVVMGRKTYEFGFEYGLESGQRAYPLMEHLVLSKSLDVPDDSEIIIARDNWLMAVDDLMTRHNTVYLCGGGHTAAFLLANERITELRLKRAPVILGAGVPLFAGHTSPNAQLIEAVPYDSGVTYERYSIG